MSAVDQLYPFSTEDGTPIPLDIVQPQRCTVVDIATGAHSAFVLSDSQRLAYVVATVDCFLDFTGIASYPFSASDSALFLPANTVLTIHVPGVISPRVIPLPASVSGKLMITGIRKWAGIGLARQLQQR